MVLVLHLRNNLSLNGYFRYGSINFSVSLHGKLLLIALFDLAKIGRRILSHELPINNFEFSNRSPYGTKPTLLLNFPLGSAFELYLDVYLEMEFLLRFTDEIVNIIFVVCLI